jgi:hypothetical protein
MNQQIILYYHLPFELVHEINEQNRRNEHHKIFKFSLKKIERLHKFEENIKMVIDGLNKESTKYIPQINFEKKKVGIYNQYCYGYIMSMKINILKLKYMIALNEVELGICKNCDDDENIFKIEQSKIDKFINFSKKIINNKRYDIDRDEFE